MIWQVVLAIIIAYLLIKLGGKIVHHYFYDPIGKARDMIDKEIAARK